MSNLDPWPLGIPLYPERQLRFMAKAEMYKPPLKWVLEAAGAFPVRRGIGDEEALERAIELARAGEVVAIFPEGTRRNKGRRRKHKARPRTGAARIALTAGVPLVPAAIGGTENLMKLGPLRVAYGPPVELDDLKDTEMRTASKIATERLMAAIHSLEKTL
jgi:1-acyl-sn-glycerol-3-phosphate acyltransferase